MKAIAPEERGLASSLVTESRQVGAVLGVAVLGAVGASFEASGGTGPSPAGLALGMLVAAGAAVLAALVAFRLLPRAGEREIIAAP